MGVDVDPEVMIGISFNSQDEAKEFIENNFEGVLDGDMEDLCGDIGLDWQEFSGYVDRGGVIGHFVGEGHLHHGTNKVDEIWELLWGIIPQEFHEKIEPHIWARYW